jgi:hypothetical protein
LWGGGGEGAGGQVFGMEHLGVLRGDELEGRLRGDGGPWDAESVRAAVRADHGYREGSLPVLWLVNAIAVTPTPLPASSHPHDFAYLERLAAGDGTERAAAASAVPYRVADASQWRAGAAPAPSDRRP